MKPSAFAETVLKLLGVFGLVTAVQSLPGLATYRAMSAQGGDGTWKVMAFPVLTVVLYAALGAWFLVNGRAIATRIVPADDTSQSLSLSELQAAAFSVLGIYFCVVGLSGLARDAANYFLLEGRESEWVRDEFVAKNKLSLIESGVYFLSGVGVFLGGGGLVNLWRRLRTMRPSNVGDEAR